MDNPIGYLYRVGRSRTRGRRFRVVFDARRSLRAVGRTGPRRRTGRARPSGNASRSVSCTATGGRSARSPTCAGCGSRRSRTISSVGIARLRALLGVSGRCLISVTSCASTIDGAATSGHARRVGDAHSDARVARIVARPVAHVRRRRGRDRARGRRRGRGRRTSATTIRLDDTRIAAPTVVVGDIDLAVLSTSFDDDGARGPIDPSVVDAVRAVPGVAGAQGAMQRFVDVVRTDDTLDTQPPASERSAIAISWEDGAPLSFSAGGPPQQARTRSRSTSRSPRSTASVWATTSSCAPVGAERPRRRSGRSGPTAACRLRVAAADGLDRARLGVFTPAGGDVDDINLVVIACGRPRRRHQPTAVRPGRHRRRQADVPIDELLDRVSAVLPSGTMVVPPSVVGFDEQLRAELEIQRAYHWLLNPDLARASRRRPSVRRPTRESAAQNQQTYDQNLMADRGHRAARLACRVRRRRDRAGHLPRVLRRTCRRPVVPKPMTGVAERIDGAVAPLAGGLCELAPAAKRAVRRGGGTDGVGRSPCRRTAGTRSTRCPAWPTRSACSPIRRRPSTSASRSSTAATSCATRSKPGVKADARPQPRCRSTCRARGSSTPTHAQVLYSVIADGDPHLETPYPLVGNAVLVDGAWKVASRFACGLNALATLSCPAAAALPTTTTSHRPRRRPPVPATVDHRSAVDRRRRRHGPTRLGRGADDARHPDVDGPVTRVPRWAVAELAVAAAEEDRRDQPRGEREPVGEEPVEQHREHRVVGGDARRG